MSFKEDIGIESYKPSQIQATNLNSTPTATEQPRVWELDNIAGGGTPGKFNIYNSLMQNNPNQYAFHSDLVQTFTSKLHQNFQYILGPTNPAFIDVELNYHDIAWGYRLEYNPNGILWRVSAAGIPHPDDFDKYVEQQRVIEGATRQTFADFESSSTLSEPKMSSSAVNQIINTVGIKQYKFVPVSTNSSNELFYLNIDKLYNFALEYANGNYASANMLTLQFIRRDKYFTAAWDEAAGEIDYEFIRYVTDREPELAVFFNQDSTFIDPSGNAIDFAHFAATLNGLVYYTRSPRSFAVGEKHIDNLVGWAGDIQTFIMDVRKATNNSYDYSVVYQAAYNLLGGQNTTFSMSNLFADTDAVNISKELSSSPLSSVFRSYYSDGGYGSRIIQFVQRITGDPTINKEKLNSLVGIYTNKYFALGIEWPLLKGVDVSPSESIAIRDAFADRIWDMVELERIKLLHEV